MSKTNQILKKVANEAVTKEHIISYLDVVKNNLNLSVLNQAMVYLQKPTAKMVCGKKAWESMERTITAGAKPIVLFFPVIEIKELPEEFKIEGMAQVVGDTNVPIYEKEAAYRSDYIPVNAFDFESTDGAAFSEEKPEHEPFADVIGDVTGISIEMTDTVRVDKINKYSYDKEKNILYISNEFDFGTDAGLKGYECVLLKAYLAYIFDSYNIGDKCLNRAIEYVICEHFGFPHNIKQGLFRKLDEKSEIEKLDFLQLVQFYTSGIVQDFEGYVLNFNETAIVNDVLYTAEHEKLYRLFDKIIVSIEDELLKEEINNLKSKLLRTEDGYLEKLLSLRMEHKVYTYPPQPIDLDKTDYLKNERKELMEVRNKTLLSDVMNESNS